MGHISTLLSVDGESAFKRALNDIVRQLKTLDKDLTATQTRFTTQDTKMKQSSDILLNYGNQITLLSQKQELLKGAVERAETAIQNSKTVLQNASAQFARVSFNVDDTRLKLDSAKKTWEESGEKVQRLSARLQEANTRHAATTHEVQKLRSVLDMAKKIWGENSVEVQKIRDKLQAAETRYASTNREVQKLQIRLEEAKKAYGANSEQVQKLETELKQFEEEQKKAAKEVQNADKELEKAEKAYHNYRQQLADTTTQLNRTEANERSFRESLGQTDKTVKENSASLSAMTEKLRDAAAGFAKVAAEAAKIQAQGLQYTFQAINKEFEIGLSGLKAYTEAFTAATVAVGGFAIKNGTSFEASMSKVRAYSGVTEEEMQLLSDAAKEMGATTSKTASEAADALGFLALNGYKTEEMLSALKPTVKAAEAGGMSLATVADYMANSLTAYGKSASDAEEFLNVLTATQNNSSTSIEQLLVTYRDLSGTFKMLDVDFNESATLLGLVANRGLKGAEAGTALNSVMLRLLGTNKNAATALNSIGVSAWDDTGKFKGLTATLREVNEKMADMNDQEKALFEKEVSGVMRFQEFNKLLDAANDIEAYEELYNTVSHATENNFLYTTAETMLDNMRGKLTLMKSASEALGISIFETFSDEAVGNIEKFTFWINKLDEGVRTGRIEEAIKNVGSGMSDALTQAINTASRELPSKLNVFNTIIIQGVRLLTKGIKESKTKILPQLIEGATDLALALVDELPSFLSEVTDGAVILFSGLVDGLQQVADRLVDKAPEMISTLSTALTENAPTIYGKGFEVLMTLIRGITENLPQIMATAGILLEKLAKGITKHLPELVKSAVEILNALISFIGDNADLILSTGLEIIGKVVDGLIDGDTLYKLFDAALKIIEAIADYLIENSETIFTVEMPRVIDKLASKFMTKEADDKMREVGEKLGQGILNGLIQLIAGGFDSAVRIGMREWLYANGIEGPAADMFINMVSSATKEKDNSSSGMFAATEDRIREIDEASAAYRDAGITLGYDNTVAEFSDGSFGPYRPNTPSINVYSPTINTQSDLDRLIESSAQMYKQALAGGGKF